MPAVTRTNPAQTAEQAVIVILANTYTQAYQWAEVEHLPSHAWTYVANTVYEDQLAWIRKLVATTNTKLIGELVDLRIYDECTESGRLAKQQFDLQIAALLDEGRLKYSERFSDKSVN